MQQNCLDKTGDRLAGGLGQIPIPLAFNAALSIDARANNTQLIGVITSDFTIAIVKALEGDCGVINVVQDGTGGHKITAITCAGFVVRFIPSTLASINTPGFKVALAPSVLTYQIAGGYCYISVGDSTAPGYA